MCNFNEEKAFIQSLLGLLNLNLNRLQISKFDVSLISINNTANHDVIIEWKFDTRSSLKPIVQKIFNKFLPTTCANIEIDDVNNKMRLYLNSLVVDIQALIIALQNEENNKNYHTFITEINLGVNCVRIISSAIFKSICITLPQLQTLHIHCRNHIEKDCLDFIILHCKNLKSFILNEISYRINRNDIIKFIQQIPPQLQHVNFLNTDMISIHNEIKSNAITAQNKLSYFTKKVTDYSTFECVVLMTVCYICVIIVTTFVVHCIINIRKTVIMVE